MANVKAYDCQRCDRSFARSEHLRRHERSHTKEKPFRCVMCTKAFTRKDLLRRHVRISHEPQEPSDANTHPSISVSSPLHIEHQVLGSSPPTHDLLAFPDQPGAMISPEHINNSAFGPHLENGAHFAIGQYHDNVNQDQNNVLRSQDIPMNSSNNEFDVFTYTADNFTSFLDSISVPRHPFSPAYQPLPQFFELGLQMPPPYERRPEEDAERLPAERCDNMGSRLGSRLPSLQPDESPTSYRSALESKPTTHVSSSCRDRMISSLKAFPRPDTEGFTLPSRHTLSRFIIGYVTGFHEHYPFLHFATLDVDSMSLELILAISALGAQYCREPEQGLELFNMAKLVTMKRIQRSKPSCEEDVLSEQRGTSTHTERNFGNSQIPFQPPSNSHRVSKFGSGNIDIIQTLLLLIAMATWSQQNPPFQEALSLRSILDTLVRDEGLEQPIVEEEVTWERWIDLESAKRTKFMVFCFFNIHTIIFDLPPVLLSEEVKLDLPCTEKEWRAKSVEAWQEARKLRTPEPNFQDALQSLFDVDNDLREMTCFSSLAGYILIHAVIQQIWVMRQVARMPPRNSLTLTAPEITSLELALKRWRYCWERNQESSLDPLSPHGPLAFTSTALLRLAYIRTSTDVSSVRLLSTWNPHQIARSFIQTPLTQRSERVTKAALHCAHALSIPIKLGINFVAQTQVVLWSNQHALCSLECAFLLTNWLQSITKPDLQPGLTEQERRLLEFVVEMVVETDFKANRAWLLENDKRLSAIIARLWAKLFRSDGIWEMVSLIGRSLNAYADLLDNG